MATGNYCPTITLLETGKGKLLIVCCKDRNFFYVLSLTITSILIGHITEEPEVRGSLACLANTSVKSDLEIFSMVIFPFALIQEAANMWAFSIS